MANFNLQMLGEELTQNIKRATWFPYKTGKLKYNATMGSLVAKDIYLIKFDSSIAPYVEYLEEGTRPHDIPRAFGRPLPFGIGGRFNGKFHSGSTKHKDFIKRKCINEILEYITTRYKGVVDIK